MSSYIKRVIVNNTDTVINEILNLNEVKQMNLIDIVDNNFPNKINGITDDLVNILKNISAFYFIGHPNGINQTTFSTIFNNLDEKFVDKKMFVDKNSLTQNIDNDNCIGKINIANLDKLLHSFENNFVDISCQKGLIIIVKHKYKPENDLEKVGIKCRDAQKKSKISASNKRIKKIKNKGKETKKPKKKIIKPKNKPKKLEKNTLNVADPSKNKKIIKLTKK